MGGRGVMDMMKVFRLPSLDRQVGDKAAGQDAVSLGFSWQLSDRNTRRKYNDHPLL